MRQHASEQIGGQADRPDRFQPFKFAHHTVDVGPTRIAAHEVQQSPRTGCRRLGLVIVRCRRGGRPQQSIEPVAHLRGEPPVNRCGEVILVGANRATDDAFDTVGCRRLDAERTATRLQLRGQPIVIPRLRDGVVAEPRPERRGVGNRRLAEVEEDTDFGPLSFTGVEPERLRRERDVECASQPCDRLRIEHVRATREAASVAEEQQHDGEAEPVRSAFRCHESVVGRCQVPAAIARAGRVARQDVHDEIVAVGSSLAGNIPPAAAPAHFIASNGGW